MVRWGERVTTVDYPPVALYELAVAGAAYRIFFPSFDNSRFLNAAIKLPGVLAEMALTWLLWRVVARRRARSGTLGAGAYWANPAMILAGAVLGYLDALMALPALGAVTAAAAGAPVAAGALLALACLTKVQAIFVLPSSPGAVELRRPRREPPFCTALASLIVAVSALRLRDRISSAGPRAISSRVSARCSAPRHALGGRRESLVGGFLRDARVVPRPANSAPGRRGRSRLRILGISTVDELGYPNPRPIATLDCRRHGLVALARTTHRRPRADVSRPR